MRISQHNHQQEAILRLIRERRLILSREGGRKLYCWLKPKLESMGIKMGRDKLFDLLREKDMLVYRKKRYHKTTNSMHRFYKHKNLIKEFRPNAPNQLWVADITYLSMSKGHSYLALITDAYSRKIVGYDISDSLELAGSLRALKMALKQLPKGHNLIHHSDRGIQYCSNAYTEMLSRFNIKISMTQENHCYENAMAERVNGILKDEFYLDNCFKNTKVAKKTSKNAIELYNEQRLHLSLDYKTPNQVHQMVA
ncbi:MAG: hypothetical protein CL663_01185 [Bacteroidetes bacterium]|nr:hypothetical protein [Bacteroidota bacterium]